jgi:large subunit ribosomal protein L21
MYAIVQIAGEQVKVSPSAKVFVPKMDAKVGGTVTFNDVLLLSDDIKTTVGAPTVKGASVEAIVLGHVKDDKVLVFHKKKRKNSRKMNGHRQQFTQIEITKIG